MKSLNPLVLLKELEAKGFHVTPPIDVDDIARLLGITVREEQSDDFVGKIEFDEQEKPVVTLNSSENLYEPRRRFTLAHEIGHYCLHASPDKEFVDSRKNMTRNGSYWNHLESEANSFAAQLLMPKELIIKKGSEIADNYKKDGVKIPRDWFIEMMADVFGVSFQAMEIRLKTLGIVAN